MEKSDLNIKKMGADLELKKLGIKFIEKTARYNYAYNFTWLGLPIIQRPGEIIIMQEIVYAIKPDLIIETGIAHGGSMVFYASLLEYIGKGKVLGIDIDILPNTRKVIEKNKLNKYINIIEGSSISEEVVAKVREFCKGKKSVLVCLDSNHTHDHVLRELELYSPFVSKGSYIVVFDTVIEDLPAKTFLNKPYGKGNNPKTAVWEFLKNRDDFIIDESKENKLIITVAPHGFLKKKK